MNSTTKYEVRNFIAKLKQQYTCNVSIFTEISCKYRNVTFILSLQFRYEISNFILRRTIHRQITKECCLQRTYLNLFQDYYLLQQQ